jgi:hypothetical protein
VTERIVVVASTANIVVATMWREILVAEGIAAELGGTNMSTSVYAMMPQIVGIDVLVREEDAVRARELIDQAERDADGADQAGPADQRDRT